MIYDYYAYLSMQREKRNTLEAWSLASGFVDECTCRFAVQGVKNEKEKSKERVFYMEQVSKLDSIKFPDSLCFEPNFNSIPAPTWVGIEVDFKLTTPWYSKDDRIFHVMDNPVRKDRIFGVPHMSAASWKGLLRWACRMQEGLYAHLQQHQGKLEGWKDKSWIVHLFGNEKGEEGNAQQGALVFYPTWFSKINFEVINPHSRRTRAGTQPIYYEVVPEGTRGILRLLYAPLPGSDERNQVDPWEAVAPLLVAIDTLLRIYGISAKRTVGWGTAVIEKWKAYKQKCEPIEKDSLQEFKKALRLWF